MLRCYDVWLVYIWNGAEERAAFEAERLYITRKLERSRSVNRFIHILISSIDLAFAKKAGTHKTGSINLFSKNIFDRFSSIDLWLLQGRIWG